MTILCITGAPAPALQHMSCLLQQAGMALANGLDRLPPLSLEGWHERVLARTHGGDRGEPGRLWDQLAADLFLANIDTPLWGWCDKRSAALLDYWAAFEPGLNFVLLCETPQRAVARLMAQADAAPDIVATLADWRTTHQALLRFHLRNPQRSVLLWAQEAVQDAAATLQHLANKWNVSLDSTVALPSVAMPEQQGGLPLALYLAGQILGQYPELDSLLQELQASVTLLQPDSEQIELGGPAAPSAPGLIDAYRSLADRSEERRAIGVLRAEVQTLAAQGADAQAQAQTQAERAAHLEQSLRGQAEELARLLSRCNEQAALAEARLQQVQGLEQQLAREASARAEAHERCAALSQAKALEQEARAQAQVERDVEAQAKAQALEQCDALAQEKQQLAAARDALVHEKNQLTAARDAEAKARTEVIAQRDAEAQAKAQAMAQRDAEAQAKAAALAQLSDESRARQHAEAQVREAQEETELLLLRLRQAQEELEGCFRKQVEFEKRLAELQRQHAAEAQAKQEALAQRDALAGEKKQLVAARDAEAKAKAEAIAQRDAEARAKQEALAQRDALAGEKKQLAATRDAEAKAKAEAIAQRDAEAQAKAAALAQLHDESHARQRAEAQVREAQEETELLLLRLRQAQEELEGYFRKHEESERRLAELQQQHAAEAKAKQEALAQRDALAGEKKQLAAARDAEAKAKAQAVAQRDVEAKAKQEALAQCDALAAEKKQLAMARDAEAKACQQMQTELRLAREETDRLLPQLRQAQGELKNYLQKYQTAEDQLRAAQARWQRMLQRNPAYCDFDALEVLPPQRSHADEMRWRVHGLEAAGRRFDQLEFSTTRQQGMVGVGIERKPGTLAPLLRWPDGVDEGGQLLALLAGDADGLKAQVAVLADLSTTDWDLMQALPKVLLAQPERLPRDWASSLYKHQQLLASLPPALRFDTLQLVREQTNPDYEHLWLRLGNLSLGEQRWPSFEFRLACANVGLKRFGQQPKLEFPLGAQPALQGWFEESEDDFGPKLEVRFALPKSMDVQVWARLPAQDRQLIVALLAVLPRLLGLLPGRGLATRRPLEEWQTMAAHMLSAVRRLTVPARSPVAQPAAETASAVLEPATGAADSKPQSPVQVEASPQAQTAQTRKRAPASADPTTKAEL